MRKLFFFFISFPLIAQEKINPEFVPHLDTLKASIIAYHRAAALAELEQYNFKTKANWLNFFPSPGITLGAPTINYNLSNVSQAINAKNVKQASIEAIKLQWQVNLNTAWAEIVLLRESLISKINAYNASFDLLTLHKAKFDIVKTGYAKSEITPTDFLSAQLTLSQFVNELRNTYSLLVTLRNELLIKSKKSDGLTLFDGLLNAHHLKSKK